MFNRSVNKVVLVGNLGKEPEMRQMNNGCVVTNLALATTMSWKNKQTDERQNKTEWHRLTVYGRLGEMCAQYLNKGAKIYAEGRLETQKWQDKTSGLDRYSTNIIVSVIQLLDSNNHKPLVNSIPAEDASEIASPAVAEGRMSFGEKPSSAISDHGSMSPHYAEIEDDDVIPF